MGIHNRDYIRDERPDGGSRGGGFGGFGGGFGGQWAIKYLLIANIAVFLLQNLNPQVTNWLDLKLAWQTVTSGPVSFIENDSLRDGIPREISISVGEKELTIPPNTEIQSLGAQTEHYAAIRWGDRYGLIPIEDLESAFRVDALGSWQVVWRLLTSGFCHGSFNHILFNLFVLWMFGRAVESILGSREFLVFYLTGVVISGLGHLLFSVITRDPTGALGASGGVMAVVFLTAMTFPKMKVYVMFIIPMDLWVMAVIYAVVDTMGLLQDGSGVAHAAHLGGAAFGVGYKYYNWRLIPLWYGLLGRTSGWKRPRRNPNVRIFQPSAQPPDEPIDERVDGILEKIHQQGEASLTDEEREVLKEASRRLKDK
ncbi:MAG: rhomboid family intramembrane serine protease [Planctomycetaceae bacterium]|jgi:membrane associated rhomboid family serine protease|nr:rhomboid family intramembrane serine protease [Planctomycetaceae bacterium]MBT6487519.1 rhomboid family intramembrane serine protease [Planctomycetaceae bacterium]MBT6495854.1 rhomboid family intramembrane serine protease [Planctomycetaceae bacterium]